MNRVDPWGDLHAVSARGLFTGNRGCLVDETGRVVRHHRGALWITCRTSFRGRRHPLDAARVWTPLFFLDDALALAAGHRPCGECRRAEYGAYRAAVTEALGASEPLPAADLDRLLRGERLRRGRGISRAGDRITRTHDPRSLPTGAVFVDPCSGHPHLAVDHGARPFSFQGWRRLVERPPAPVEVLTPPTSMAALEHGFRPTLHPSAGSA
jgi:hypothetical protein